MFLHYVFVGLKHYFFVFLVATTVVI